MRRNAVSKENAIPENTNEIPSLMLSVIVFLLCAFTIGFSVMKLGISPHVPMLISAAICGFVGIIFLKKKWSDIQDGIVQGINLALIPILILMLIGLVVASWIASGTVPALIYYGLDVLSPRYFLLATLVVCSVTALATGSSWTTAGTVGLALMGVGKALGIPAEMIAGAVVSGAYFGDKMSPLSDTTNLAPAIAGGELFDHIRAMLWSTLPAFVIAAIAYTIMGFRFSGDIGSAGSIALISTTIKAHYYVGFMTLLPPILVIYSAIKKYPAIPSLIGAVILAGIIAAVFQDITLKGFLDTIQHGYISKTGSASVDQLLSRGGLESMMYTVSLIICALSFGGIMEKCGFLESILISLGKILEKPASLIGTTLLSSYLCNMFLGDQFLGIIVPGRTFKPAYDKMGLAPRMLSRTLEDSGTLTSPLIPWTACGAYMVGVLGVNAFAFVPYAIVNWLTPIVAFVITLMGIGVFWKKEDGTITSKKAEAAVVSEENLMEYGRDS
ncbi:MAG: Na+/H+ antiporter NhaC [Desulfobacteraceae bacterium]|nr:Na+/H+ antiporter NhaC [Desulfobacteraceae bacterium]